MGSLILPVIRSGKACLCHPVEPDNHAVSQRWQRQALPLLRRLFYRITGIIREPKNVVSKEKMTTNSRMIQNSQISYYF